MKAVVVEKPNKVVVKDVPEPVVGSYNALCEILACAVCNGSDNHIVQGDPVHTIKYGVKYPLILGHEAIGRVVKCGSKIKNFKVGDLVTRVVNKLPKNGRYFIQQGHGAFAEKGIVVDWQAMRDDGLSEKKWKPYTFNQAIPKNFDPVKSTMIITWRETLAFLKRMKPQKNDTMLIIGSGANALAFADHAKNLKLNTIVIGNPKRKKSFAHTKTEFISYLGKKIPQQKADIIIDSIGKSESLNKIIHLLKDGGKIGIYGLDEYLSYKINSSKAQGDFTIYSGEIYEEGSAHKDIINYIKKGKLNAWNYLSKKHIYPLSKIKEALKASREGRVIKSAINLKKEQ